MGAPAFSPSGGVGSTYTDPSTGATYRFAGGTNWQQISSGARQSAPSRPSGGSSGGGGGGKQHGGWYWDASQGKSVQYWDPNRGPDGGGGDSGGGGGEPDWGSMISELYEPYKKELDNIEGSLKSEYATDEGLIGKQHDLNVASTESNRDELIGSTDREEDKYNKVLGSAYEQSIRDFNALQQQSNARFGGGSSAGRAMGELAQREYFREQGKINDKRAEGSLEFGLERGRIKKYVTEKLDQLKLEKEKALADLKKQLRIQMNEIAARRHDIEANKTRDRMSLLQDTMNQARQLRMADQQFRQGLATAAISKMQEIEGRQFTPAEIQATLAEFGINLSLGRSIAPQGSGRQIVGRPGSYNEEDEFSQ